MQLLPDYRCLPLIALAKEGALFGKPERPAFCVSLRPTKDMGRSSRDEALDYLNGLELATGPKAPASSAQPCGSAGAAVSQPSVAS